MKGQWTEVSWDIADYRNVVPSWAPEQYQKIDMGRIVAVEFYEWWDGDYYFDNMWVGINSGFTVATDETYESLPRGGTTSTEVRVGRVGLYENGIVLSCENVPPGVEVDFSKSSGMPDFISTMTLTVGPETVPGIYPISIIGTGEDGLARSCVYTLVVGESMFQNFESNNGTPGDYFYEVYYTDRSFEDSVVHSGSRSLKVRTRASEGGGNGGTVGINVASQSGVVNMENATTLMVWVWDAQGHNNIELTLKDKDGNTGDYGYSTLRAVKNRWTMITWDISGTKSGLDKSNIASIELYEWWDGDYYFDDISYIAIDDPTRGALESFEPPAQPNVSVKSTKTVVAMSIDIPPVQDRLVAPEHQMTSTINKDDYKPFGEFISSVFDAGTPVYWGTISWNASTPPSTSLTVYTRVGVDDNPADGGWSDWVERSNGGDLPYESRYIQYRLILATEDGKTTPVFEGITITYGLNPPSDWFSILLLAAVIIALIGGAWYWNRRKKRPSKNESSNDFL